MATISTLAEEEVLIAYRPPLGRRELLNRRVFLYPELCVWLAEILPSLEPMDDTDLPPRMQVAALLKQFVVGRPLEISRQFKKLRPLGDDVWELKTPDVRIFGWFAERDTFIGVVADSMERTKAYDLYAGYVGHVVRVRSALGLDEPKFLAGADYNDVLSD